ncbi:hypothetical protein MMC19_002050 [Ptychographa xylographoides]|nr:hypothetical protein [Ptychographa xylographoides]
MEPPTATDLPTATEPKSLRDLDGNSIPEPPQVPEDTAAPEEVPDPAATKEPEPASTPSTPKNGETTHHRHSSKKPSRQVQSSSRHHPHTKAAHSKRIHVHIPQGPYNLNRDHGISHRKRYLPSHSPRKADSKFRTTDVPVIEARALVPNMMIRKGATVRRGGPLAWDAAVGDGWGLGYVQAGW